MDEQTDVLVVGAGPTGLGAAWKMIQDGFEDWLLCEAETSAGGLASSVTDEHGFTWDLGGHVQFSHYDYFDAVMDEVLGEDGWLYHDRSSWVWLRGRFVPYPFQLNLRYLPAEEKWHCVRALLRLSAAPPTERPTNFGEWILSTFGEGIAEVFLYPYNTKVWAHPPETMSWHWIGDRVAVVDVEKVLENILLERDDVAWGPNNQFRFPKRGGTGAVWTSLAQRLSHQAEGQIRFGARLVSLDTHARLARFSDGRSIGYRWLVSSIPLDALVKLSDLDHALGERGSELCYSSTHVVGVGLDGQPPDGLSDKCWMYFPEGDCPFYRVTVFSRYSPHNVPDATRQWSLMAEVSESQYKSVSEDVVRDTIDGMLATKLVSDRRHVHHTWHRRLERGYPTPTLDRDAILNDVLPELELRSVYSRGRFGAWKYEVSNQDHSFAQGVEVIERLLDGTPERTLSQPEVVNLKRSAPARFSRR